MAFSLEGWQIVAGGRSEAKTTGSWLEVSSHPGGVQEPEKSHRSIPECILAPRRGAELFSRFPVVYAPLRPPATICQPSRLNSGHHRSSSEWHL